MTETGTLKIGNNTLVIPKGMLSGVEGKVNEEIQASPGIIPFVLDDFDNEILSDLHQRGMKTGEGIVVINTSNKVPEIPEISLDDYSSPRLIYQITSKGVIKRKDNYNIVPEMKTIFYQGIEKAKGFKEIIKMKDDKRVVFFKDKVTSSDTLKEQTAIAFAPYFGKTGIVDEFNLWNDQNNKYNLLIMDNTVLKRYSLETLRKEAKDRNTFIIILPHLECA